jgi:hypothetical protein
LEALTTQVQLLTLLDWDKAAIQQQYPGEFFYLL